MAAIVERPMSAIHDHTSTPVVPQRRRRESSPPREVEIIDVDELDDEALLRPVQPNGRRPVQRRRTDQIETIILDSDDEDYLPLPVPSSSRSRLQSPGLLPRVPSPIPPVPPIPPHLTAHTSRPVHHRLSLPRTIPHNLVPPPMRPIDHEYDFEQSLFGPGSPGLTATEIRRRTSQTPGPSSSSGHRHRPNSGSADSTPGTSSSTRPAPPLGLGGGLITSNNLRLAQEREERERRAQARATGGLSANRSRTIRRTGRGNAVHYIGPRHDIGYLFGDDEDLYVLGMMLDEHDREMMARFPMLATGLGPTYGQGMLKKKLEPDYKPNYTHSYKPEPGFTFDFVPSATDEESGVVNVDGEQSISASAFPVTSLENPIILDDDDDSSQVATGSGSSTDPHAAVAASSSSSSTFKLKSVLVCSHCRDPLILGEGTIGLSEAEARKKKVWSLRCGHLIDGTCYQELGFPQVQEGDGAEAVMTTTTRKGKAKAKAVDVSETSVDNPIRSRLRPRHGAANNANINSNAVDTNSGWSLGSLVAPVTSYFNSRGRGGHGSTVARGKAKGKGKEKVPRVEETFLWNCPVAGCSKQHESAKIDGVWGVDKESGRGAIQVFV